MDQISLSWSSWSLASSSFLSHRHSPLQHPHHKPGVLGRYFNTDAMLGLVSIYGNAHIFFCKNHFGIKKKHFVWKAAVFIKWRWHKNKAGPKNQYDTKSEDDFKKNEPTIKEG